MMYKKKMKQFKLMAVILLMTLGLNAFASFDPVKDYKSPITSQVQDLVPKQKSFELRAVWHYSVQTCVPTTEGNVHYSTVYITNYAVNHWNQVTVVSTQIIRHDGPCGLYPPPTSQQ